TLLNHQKTVMKDDNLQSIAKKLVAPGKGILAAEESTGTIEKRLKSINIPSTEENRRAYREILFTTKDAGEFISGAILFDETIRQNISDGRTFVKALEDQGIIPGIKVDKGAKAMPNFPGKALHNAPMLPRSRRCMSAWECSRRLRSRSAISQNARQVFDTPPTARATRRDLP